MGILSYLFILFFFVAPLAYAEVDPSLLLQRRAELDAELKRYEQQIDEYQNLLVSKQKEGESLTRDIDILNAKISSAKLKIKARTLSIQKLTGEIGEKSKNIQVLTGDIVKTRASLGEFLRQIKENDQYSAVELALIYQDVSQFFDELESFNKLQGSLQDAMVRFAGLKGQEEKARENLEEEKNEELELRAIQELEKASIERSEREKQQLLKITKGKESEYQKIVQEKQKNAAAIRSQLFLLSGSTSIPFEKALEYANFAEKVTGIRPAFLLGLITEESNLGQNVGKGNWREDLSHSRCKGQREAFVKITAELGLDPDKMPVSKKVWYGYCGGAMGPAQFMPTTWALYKKGITKVTGHNPPSPWDPQDAFVAAAAKLAKDGANSKTRAGEIAASKRYYCGNASSKKSSCINYANSVQRLATEIAKNL